MKNGSTGKRFLYIRQKCSEDALSSHLHTVATSPSIGPGTVEAGK
jgi:hypothetical protein